MYFLIHSKMSFIIGTMLYLSFSLFYRSVDAYDPVDVFSINCGSFGNSSNSSHITWTGDINSKLFQQVKPSVAAQALTQSSSTNTVPYTTARLSYSNFTYSFPVNPGQKFIRLYFYPTSYEQGFDRSKAFFSVTSGAFTLLKDFNTSLTADADDDPLDTIFREYSINVDEGQRLNVTFSPSTIQPDLYAFINGIEILSMPTNLYYTDSLNPAGLKLAGSTSFYSILNNSALRTEYRLNVGGSAISPRDDTGLLRFWESDIKYVTATISKLPAVYSGSKFNFTKVPNYTAPDPVYRTARSMGTNGNLNKMSNLTWEFSVDSGFTYMLRLHFCEFEPDITPYYDRVFDIYIDDKLAEEHADVLEWSGQKGVPVYRDYAVPIFGNVNKYNLSLKLHPNQDYRETAYFDAFLNGLEIFRISDPQTNNLAGPNPDPLPPAPPVSGQLTPNQKKRSSTTIIGVVAGVVDGVVLLSLLARGTLRDHLYNTGNPPLSWKQRVQICIGAARGLHYLHTGAKQMIIHRDVKSTNILLDEQWVAKVSDFGLSKIGPSGISRSHITTVIKGSFGYLDPDYYTRQRLTIKSDVYAFGVVLLEVLCGRPPLLRTIDKSKICLSDCAHKCYHEGIIDQMVDPFLKGRIAPECLKKSSDIAMNCLLDDGSQRPSMNDVIWGLEFSLQLQEDAEQRDQISSKVEVMERSGIQNEDSHDMFSSSSGRTVSGFNKSSEVSMTSSVSGDKETDKLMHDSAFSEIMDQKAR